MPRAGHKLRSDQFPSLFGPNRKLDICKIRLFYLVYQHPVNLFYMLYSLPMATPCYSAPSAKASLACCSFNCAIISAAISPYLKNS